MNINQSLEISPEDSNFKVANDRIDFVRKVLGIVAFQLLVTAFMVTAVMLSQSLMEFVQLNPWLNVITAISALIIAIVLICFKGVSRKVPQNYILLLIFTLCEGYGVAGFCSLFEPGDVISAALGAGLLTFALMCFAYYTDEFEMLRFIGVCYISLFFITIFQLVFLFGSYNGWVSLGLAFYCVYLVIDMKMIMSEGKYGVGMEDYIVGAMIIYVDIIVIFMRLLILIASLKKK